MSTTRTTSDYTIQSSDNLIIADSSGGGVTITLPGTPDNAESYIIVAVATATGSNVTIDPNGNNLNESSTTTTLSSDGDTAVVRFSDSQDSWYIISRSSSGL